ncbi:MAG TPA: DUF4395 domain-containing protein [Acidimicrobiales bacterium]|nr:DUF4395 domain-containing protein [Acidimicrobiales bacterium]
MADLFRFPNPVNEVAARLVAGAVVVLSSAYLLTGNRVVLAVLAYGFLARVLTGPSLSPLGQVVTRVVVPRLPLEARPVPGPPKRFAQGIGATLSVAALVLHLGAGALGAAQVLVAMIVVAATLESVIGFCLGCKIFALLMRTGVIPEETCAACNDIWSRPTTSVA